MGAFQRLDEEHIEFEIKIPRAFPVSTKHVEDDAHRPGIARKGEILLFFSFDGFRREIIHRPDDGCLDRALCDA